MASQLRHLCGSLPKSWSSPSRGNQTSLLPSHVGAAFLLPWFHHHELLFSTYFYRYPGWNTGSHRSEEPRGWAGSTLEESGYRPSLSSQTVQVKAVALLFPSALTWKTLRGGRLLPGMTSGYEIKESHVHHCLLILGKDAPCFSPLCVIYEARIMLKSTLRFHWGKLW